MSVETCPQKLKLNQYDTLSAAIPIENPERIPVTELQKLFDLCGDICDAADYGGISINEIPEAYLLENGISPQLINSKIVFLRPNVLEPNEGTVTEDVLVINPRIIIDPSSEYFPHLEGCGSVRDANIVAFISRPVDFYLMGHAWSGRKRPPQKQSFQSGYQFCDLTVHEVEHTNGFCFIEFPWRFKSVKRSVQWSQIMKTYRNHTQKEFRDTLEGFGKPFLVWDGKEYLVVDHNGKYIEKFEYQPDISEALNQLDQSQYSHMINSQTSPAPRSK
ncbi:hypothetical protein KKD37_00985 [Patescibacteria group bacterium]|nr:hypothetical protein [Patescibacteria group bacterium]